MRRMKMAHVTRAAASTPPADVDLAAEELLGQLSRRGDQVRLEVRHLKLVRAVVRERGLTPAASRLHLTQPALSHQLADLERRLGTGRFLGGGRRLLPPRAGERLVTVAEAILPELEKAEQELPALGAPGGG